MSITVSTYFILCYPFQNDKSPTTKYYCSSYVDEPPTVKNADIEVKKWELLSQRSKVKNPKIKSKKKNGQKSKISNRIKTKESSNKVYSDSKIEAKERPKDDETVLEVVKEIVKKVGTDDEVNDTEQDNIVKPYEDEIMENAFEELWSHVDNKNKMHQNKHNENRNKVNMPSKLAVNDDPRTSHEHTDLIIDSVKDIVNDEKLETQIILDSVKDIVSHAAFGHAQANDENYDKFESNPVQSNIASDNINQNQNQSNESETLEEDVNNHNDNVGLVQTNGNNDMEIVDATEVMEENSNEHLESNVQDSTEEEGEVEKVQSACDQSTLCNQCQNECDQENESCIK